MPSYFGACSQPFVSCMHLTAMLPQAVMDLLSDAVPNVRLAALGLLPALKQTIRLPEDVQHLVRKVTGLHHVDVGC